MTENLELTYVEHHQQHSCLHQRLHTQSMVWGTQVQQMTIDNPRGTGTLTIPFTEAHVQTMVEQASPRPVAEMRVLVLIGRNITREDFSNNASFFAGCARATNLIHQLLQPMGFPADARLLSDLLPFADLFPWPSVEPIADGIEVKKKSVLSIIKR